MRWNFKMKPNTKRWRKAQRRPFKFFIVGNPSNEYMDFVKYLTSRICVSVGIPKNRIKPISKSGSISPASHFGTRSKICVFPSIAECVLAAPATSGQKSPAKSD